MRIISGVFILLATLTPALSLGATIVYTKSDVVAIQHLIPHGRYDGATATIKGNYALVDGYSGEVGGGTTCFQKVSGTWRISGYLGSKGVMPAPEAAKACHWSEAQYTAIYALRADKQHNVKVLP
jgi:hypothetical protein